MCVSLTLVTPWTVATRLLGPQDSPARILEWIAISSTSYSRDLPNAGIEPGSPALQADSLLSEPPGKPIYKLHMYLLCLSREVLYIQPIANCLKNHLFVNYVLFGSYSFPSYPIVFFIFCLHCRT